MVYLGRGEKVHGAAGNCDPLLAEDGHVGEVKVHGIVHIFGLRRMQIVVHGHDTLLGVEQPHSGVHEAEVVIHPELGHDVAHEIHEDQIEGSEVGLGKEEEALGSVPEPPFHPGIVEMGLGPEVFETGPTDALVQLQPHHQLQRGVLEDLVDHHVVSSSDEGHPFHLVGRQEAGGVVHEDLVVVGSQAGADVDVGVDVHAGVAFGTFVGVLVGVGAVVEELQLLIGGL
mmetsp:Transcript_34832/g.80519  ORF Transcript_34832/g.80519 Transcript_34832/m.80519 type:complete len:228 (+) Transcript_34832:1910-2593(+)